MYLIRNSPAKIADLCNPQVQRATRIFVTAIAIRSSKTIIRREQAAELPRVVNMFCRVSRSAIFSRIDKIVPALSNGAKFFLSVSAVQENTCIYLARMRSEREEEGEKGGEREKERSQERNWSRTFRLKLFGSRRSTNHDKKTIKTVNVSHRDNRCPCKLKEIWGELFAASAIGGRRNVSLLNQRSFTRAKGPRTKMFAKDLRIRLWPNFNLIQPAESL